MPTHGEHLAYTCSALTVAATWEARQGTEWESLGVALGLWGHGAEAGLLALQREFGEQHPVALNGLRHLGNTYAAHAKQLDCILEQVNLLFTARFLNGTM